VLCTVDFDPVGSDITEDMQGAVNKTLAEIMGLKSGWCSRTWGFHHLCDPASEIWVAECDRWRGIPLAQARLGRRNYRRDRA